MFQTQAIYFFIFVLLNLSYAKYSKREREEVLAIGLYCINETGVEPNIIENVFRTLILPDDKKYKEFLACSYKRQGYQKEDGEISIDNIKKFLRNFYNSTDLTVIDTCAAVKGTNDGEVAFNALQCILPKLETLKTQNED